MDSGLCVMWAVGRSVLDAEIVQRLQLWHHATTLHAYLFNSFSKVRLMGHPLSTYKQVEAVPQLY